MSIKRFVNIELAGKSFPLNFSIKAMRELTEKYGDLDAALDKIDEDDVSPETFDMLTEFLYQMIDQGVKKKHYLGEKCEETPTREEIECIIDFGDFDEVMEKMTEAMSLGSTPQAKAKTAQKSKNSKPTAE
jgi:hypothetical protein